MDIKMTSSCRSIHCKHFDFGNGSCPFGSSCFYMVSYDDKWCDGLSLSLSGVTIYLTQCLNPLSIIIIMSSYVAWSTLRNDLYRII